MVCWGHQTWNFRRGNVFGLKFASFSRNFLTFFYFQNIKTENVDNVWIQTLTYEPEVDHSNKSLKCLVNFESKLDEEESKEASILLSFTIEDLVTMVKVEDDVEENPEEIIKEAVQSEFFAMAAGVVGGVFFICLAVYMLYHYKCCCFKTQPTTEVDAELGEENMTEKPAKVIFCSVSLHMNDVSHPYLTFSQSAKSSVHETLKLFKLAHLGQIFRQTDLKYLAKKVYFM